MKKKLFRSAISLALFALMSVLLKAEETTSPAKCYATIFTKAVKQEVKDDEPNEIFTLNPYFIKI